MNNELDVCLDSMARRGVDALILGREAGARAVSGADRLWLTGTRPFAPTCVVVRESGALAFVSLGHQHFGERACAEEVLGELLTVQENGLRLAFVLRERMNQLNNRVEIR